MSTIAAALCAFLFVLALVFLRVKVAVHMKHWYQRASNLVGGLFGGAHDIGHIHDLAPRAKVQIALLEKMAGLAIKPEDRSYVRDEVNKLSDQAMLAEIAVKFKDSELRATAARKLTDQALLAKIAVKDRDWEVRAAAANRLKDRALLAKIALNREGGIARVIAAEKLVDQALLAKIAVKGREGFVRRTAINNLTDQVVLAKIAMEDKESDIRSAAVEKLTDKAIWAKIIVNELRTRSLEREDVYFPLVSYCEEMEKLLVTSPSIFDTSTLETILRLNISIEYFEVQLGGMGSPDRTDWDTYYGSELKELALKELIRRSSLMAAPSTPVQFCAVGGASLLADPQHFCPDGSPH